MNKIELQLMDYALKRVNWSQSHILDVGSRDINGTYRALIEGRGWKYTGLDIVAGSNVDVVAKPFCYPFPDGAFDIVISGATNVALDTRTYKSSPT